MHTKTNIISADIWALFKKDTNIVIPTNISVKANGDAVMGRGLAYQAAKNIPELPRLYGKAIKAGKTIDGFYVFPKLGIVTLAVKRHWKEDADIKLIESQLELLQRSAEKLDYGTLLMPVIGTGFGRLYYEQVLPLILKYSFKEMLIVIPHNKVYAVEEYRESFLPGVNGKKDRRVSLSGCFGDVEI
jgi:hypothetical protein